MWLLMQTFYSTRWRCAGAVDEKQKWHTHMSPSHLIKQQCGTSKEDTENSNLFAWVCCCCLFWLKNMPHMHRQLQFLTLLLFPFLRHCHFSGISFALKPLRIQTNACQVERCCVYLSCSYPTFCALFYCVCDSFVGLGYPFLIFHYTTF